MPESEKQAYYEDLKKQEAESAAQAVKHEAEKAELKGVAFKNVPNDKLLAWFEVNFLWTPWVMFFVAFVIILYAGFKRAERDY